jgi:outer membrane protein assembly factor BamB
VIADLDGDGKTEILVPTGTSDASGTWEPSPWGELEALDAGTGKPRWKRRLKNMDSQVDHFLAGTDVDGDGIRDVFAVSLWGKYFDLYVDALSGRDGSTLWTSRKRLRPSGYGDGYHLASPSWWQAGNDGWPQLAVPVYAEGANPLLDLVYTFSTGTGELVHQASRLTDVAAIDADDDGVEDLVGLVRRGERDSTGSQSVVCFRGTRREWWRSVATLWSAAGDLDGDGRRDLVRTLGDGTMIAASSRDGRRLWSSRLPSSSKMSVPLVAAGPNPDALPTPWHLAESLVSAGSMPDNGGADTAIAGVPASAAGLGDLDGDGTTDLLGYAGHTSRGGRFRPLHALSGRTGATLWSADIAVTRIGDVLALDVRDLDRDGMPEVIFAAGSDWGYSLGLSSSSDDQQLWLAVLSGRRGAVVWKHALTRAYGLTPGAGAPAHRFDQGTLPLAYGDLDGDGTLEIIVAAETAEGPPAAVLRAVNGKTGQPMWSHSLPDGNYALTDIPPAVVTDLDQDGRADVVALDFADGTAPNGRIAWLRGRSGADGREMWSSRFDVASSWGRIDSQEVRQRCRPRPLALRTANGPPLIALNLWDLSERVVVVDARGQTVSDFRLTTEQGTHRGEFRLWSCDADGDGGDEILLTNRDHLMAIRPQAPDRPLWQRPVSSLWSDEIEGVLPRTGEFPALVVVRRVALPGSVYALDAADGRMIWEAEAPTPRREGHQVLLDRKQIALLDAGRHGQLPGLFFQHQFVSRVCEASPAVEPPVAAGGVLPDQAGVAPPTRVSASRVPARLSEDQNDPRSVRRLPWALEEGSWRDYGKFTAWGLFYSLCLVYVPAAYLLRMVRDRRWSLQRLLLMPVVAALALMAALAGGNDASLLEPLGKALLAILYFPVCVAGVRLVRWSIARRWQRVAIWLAATVLAAGLMAGVVLWVAQTQGMGLQPGEHYAWGGWYWIWFFGAYDMCWLLTLALPVVGTFRAISRWRRP